MAGKLKVTLVKSTIGAIPKHRATVEALGLKKLNKSVELPDNDAVRNDLACKASCKGRRDLSRIYVKRKKCLILWGIFFVVNFFGIRLFMTQIMCYDI